MKPKVDRYRRTRSVIAHSAAMIFIAVFLLNAPAARSANIFVTTTADGIDAGGSTCAGVTIGLLPGPGGQTTLREAVCAANNNFGPDVIFFNLNGVFGLTGAANNNNGTSGDLDIKDSLTIQGNSVAATVIDGNANDRIFDVFLTSAGTFAISNMTVRNGDTRATLDTAGAMLLNNNVTATITNCEIINNFSGLAGAVVNQGNLTINNSVLSGNQTIPPSGSANGGALTNVGTLSINNTKIDNNSVRGEGGGIAISTAAGVTVAITGSTISNNNATVTGGGLGNGGGLATTGNQGTINMTNCTISGNHAHNNGGGLYFATPASGTGNANLNSVTVTNNRADFDNNGSGAGGGIAHNTAAVKLQNTLVAGNFHSLASVRDDISGAMVASSSYNLIGDGTGMTGISNNVNNNQVGSGGFPINAKLNGLANNGGLTQTHQLQQGSPAIDTANNATSPGTDQRNVTRPFDGDNIAGAVSDIGAYERNIPPSPAPVVTNTNDSGPGSLRQALADADNGDTITFNFGTRPHAPAIADVITLTSGELIIDDNIIIDGPGANALVVERNNAAPNFRIFHVNSANTVTIEGMTIRNGRLVGSDGGGIFSDHSNLTVNGCDIIDNTADFFGGGIMSFGSGGTITLTVTNCSITGNSTGSSGGGIMNWGEGSGSNATLIVSNSTISGNSAAFGAGIYNDGATGMATMSVNNSTFSANTAGSSGGGIANDGFNGGVGNLTVSNSTFYKNTAFSGGGIFTFGSSGGTATVHIGNTILLTGTTGSDIDITCFQPTCNNTVTSHGYNLSNQGGAGVLNATGDQINTDPMLGPLKDNGGPTLTHAPLINSPIIDQGKRDAIPSLTTNFDQRGLARPVSDPAVVNFADASDIGAVEIGQFVHPTGAASRKTHGGAGSFSISLPLTGPVGIECRSGGATNDYQVIFNFAGPVSFSTPAVVTSGSGSVASSAGNGTNQITLNLSGVTNAQTITLALFGVSDGVNIADVGLRMGMLLGDTSGNGTVNSTDVSETKLRSGQVVGAANFRSDVNANGAINATDVSTVKLRSGSSLP
jgi:dockerin type I repeat protein/parallel beta helix pectate lyase-like protein